jgi:hypothetical protein
LLKNNADPNAQDKRLVCYYINRVPIAIFSEPPVIAPLPRVSCDCSNYLNSLAPVLKYKTIAAIYHCMKLFKRAVVVSNRSDTFVDIHSIIEVVEYLLSMHPASLNAANHEGRTALHLVPFVSLFS